MTNLHQRPALDTLAELHRGKFKDEITEELHKLIAACTDTGKKGSLVITLNLEPDVDADADSTRLKVGGSVVTKTPRRTRKPSIFFVDDSGNFTRRDPREDDYHGLVEVPAQPDDESDTDARSRAASER